MNLVVGSTGLLGMEICRLLAEQGKPLRALVRRTSDPDKVANLKKMGAELAYGDMKEKATLDKACKGANAVISTASSTFSRQEGDGIESVDKQGQINLINAAEQAGVKQFILISFVKDPSFSFPLADAKSKVEERLRISALDYTILEANFFMEVWLSPALGFDYNNATARVYGDGTSRISWISYKDVAKFAVAALENNQAKNQTLKIGGPDPLSPLEVIRQFEQASGDSFAVEHVPLENLKQQFESAPNPLDKSFAALTLAYAMGNEMDMKTVLDDFDIQLASVQDYVRSIWVKGA